MPAMGLSSLERYLPLGPRGGLAGGGRGAWARPGHSQCSLHSQSPKPGPSSSPQLGDENPDLASTMTGSPTLRMPILKLEEKASHPCFPLGLSLATHGSRGHSGRSLSCRYLWEKIGQSLWKEMQSLIPENLNDSVEAP